MRDAGPADRKHTCLRSPVIGPGFEFGAAVPSEAKGRISVNPREFNVIKKGHAARAQEFNSFAQYDSPFNSRYGSSRTRESALRITAA